MIDFQRVWRQAEAYKGWILAGTFFLLAGLLLLQTILSPFFVLMLGLGVAFVVVTFYRPLATVAFLAIYLPFEPFLLKFVPDDIYLFARFFSEGLIYLLVSVVVWRILSGTSRLRSSPIDLPFLLFVLVLLASSVINVAEPTTALLGMRQILRFVSVFFIVYYLNPDRGYIKRLTWVMFSIVLIQSILGIAQSIIGAPLDQFLLPSQVRSFGDITLTKGVEQFWDPGSRVFGTLGRYDRLGNFLYIFLLLGVGILYNRRLTKHRRELLWLFALGVPTLILTFSRSSWFAFLFGFLFVALWIKRDRRVMAIVVTFLIVVVGYLGISGLNVRYLAEAPGQTLVERFYESFSYTRWRGEYFGFGRVYWFVQTPLSVVPASPFFGHGPGQYGGGAAAALSNTRVYDNLGLPYGVFGTEGFIDINWFSLWGETGTIGLVFYLWMYLTLFFYAISLYRDAENSWDRALSIGFAALLIGMAFNAFTSTLFEIRTVGFYLWLYAAFVVVLGQRQAAKLATSPDGEEMADEIPERLQIKNDVLDV